MAILQALNFVKSKNLDKVAIFSDSRSVLSALSSTVKVNKASYLIIRIREEIFNLKNSGKEVCLFWIPSHCGITGNEIADINAKNAISQGIDTQLPIPYKDFLSEWKNLTYVSFNEWCLESFNYTGKYYFQHFYKQDRSSWFDKASLNRKQIVSISRLRSGHSSLKSSLHRFNITTDPFCSCGEEETADHIILKCVNFAEKRSVLFKKLQQVWGSGPYKVEDLLNTTDKKIINALGTFINEISIDI